MKENKKQNKEMSRLYGTRDSRVIPHPSTNRACERLSCEFGMGSPACATSMAVCQPNKLSGIYKSNNFISSYTLSFLSFFYICIYSRIYIFTTRLWKHDGGRRIILNIYTAV
jgi:hypothetical protein